MDQKYTVNKGMHLNFNEEESKHLFFTSDTHFWHENVIKFCDRPFDTIKHMTDALIDNWNSIVGPDDTVFHLGDFCWGNPSAWKYCLEKLNGHKILVLGNHDLKNLTPSIANEYFDWVGFQLYIYINGRPIYLNHYPFLTYGGVYRSTDDIVYQLFGHTHTTNNIPYTGKDADRVKLLFPAQYDVGVDNNNYMPISWEQVDKIIKKQIEDSK